MIDYYKKYCSKCIHKDVPETDTPCKECTDEFFKSSFESRKFPYFKRRRK